MSPLRAVVIACLAGSSAVTLALADNVGPANAPPPAATKPLSPDDVERALGELERRSLNLRAELERSEARLRELEITRIVRGRAYVRLARTGLLPIGGGFDALMSHAAQLERLRHGLAQVSALHRGLSERRHAIRSELEAIRLEQGPLQVQAEAMALARDALRSSQERALAFERAFLNPEPHTSHTAVYGGGLNPADANAGADGFASMKGRLPFPLAGRSEVRRLRRPGASGLGLEMLATRGAAVHAVYAGRVAFADEYPEYGNTVIVAHSQGYYTVSAALETIEVRSGDEVIMGTRLGTVGGDAPSAAGARSYLYFEIRSGTDVIDPNIWFGI